MTYVITANDVDSALYQGLTYLKGNGELKQTRAGEALVSPCPVMTVNKQPMNRVLFNRPNANPFFHLMEALWMLAGRNDSAFLNNFIGDFGSRFAEPDGHLHGAYGFRWRAHFDMEGGGGGIEGWWPDQLTQVVEMLQANPEDRRVVISMWDPVADLGADAKDIPCLAGDTTVWSPEGNRPIAELAASFAAGELRRWPVYSVDPTDWSLHFSWCSRIWKSGEKRVIRLTFDDGSSLKLTSNHIVYKREGRRSHVTKTREVQAGELVVGDRLLATQLWTDGKGYQYAKRLLGKNTAFANRQKIHTAYWTFRHGPVPEGCVVHHDNDDKCNNSNDNLLCWTKSKHDSYHRLGDRNPMRRMSPGQHRARGRKQSIALTNSWNRLSPEERKLRAKGLLDNHVIVAIEDCGVEPVYDFEVPGNHNALVGTGVVIHNCNTHIYPRVRQLEQSSPVIDPQGRFVEPGPSVLDLTVCCRSNDAIWGAHGANAVHFSVLQEYLAAKIGVGIGTLYQLSNNYHVYTSELAKVDLGNFEIPGWYGSSPQIVTSVVSGGATAFDYDLEHFFSESWSYVEQYHGSFFETVAVPMRKAFEFWRAGAKSQTRDTILRMPACDWRIAAQTWVNSRIKQEKQAQ